MKSTKKHVGHISELVKPFNAPSEIWAVKILDRMGVGVSDDGEFDKDEAREALEKVSARSMEEQSELGADAPFLRAAQMGNTKATVQDWLRGHFAQHGLKVIGSSRSRMTLQDQGGQKMWINTYVSMTDKSNGRKAGFSVSGINFSELPWFAFVVQPWGEVYLRRREEIIENLGKKAVEEGAAFVTISRGRVDDLFENRIEEMKKDQDSWKS